MVALDGSALSVQALRWALHLGKLAEAEVTAVHVLEPIPAAWEQVLYPYAALGADHHMIEAELIAAAQEQVQAVIAQAQADVLGKTQDDIYIHILVGERLARLRDSALKTGADLLLCGGWATEAAGRSIGLGGVAWRLCASALRPVLVVKESMGKPRLRRVLVAFDASAAAAELLNWAVSFAMWFDAAVEVVTVVAEVERQDPFLPLRERERRVVHEVVDRQLRSQLVDRFQQALKKLYVPFPKRAAFEQLSIQHHVVVGDPQTELLAASDRFEADLILVGSHHPERAERGRLGRVADGVCREASAHVMVVPLSLLLPVSEEPV
jgi:nucleotide-binding universal stress UspA family protein